MNTNVNPSSVTGCDSATGRSVRNLGHSPPQYTTLQFTALHSHPKTTPPRVKQLLKSRIKKAKNKTIKKREGNASVPKARWKYRALVFSGGKEDEPCFSCAESVGVRAFFLSGNCKCVPKKFSSPGSQFHKDKPTAFKYPAPHPSR